MILITSIISLKKRLKKFDSMEYKSRPFTKSSISPNYLKIIDMLEKDRLTLIERKSVLSDKLFIAKQKESKYTKKYDESINARDETCSKGDYSKIYEQTELIYKLKVYCDSLSKFIGDTQSEIEMIDAKIIELTDKLNAIMDEFGDNLKHANHKNYKNASFDKLHELATYEPIEINSNEPMVPQIDCDISSVGQMLIQAYEVKRMIFEYTCLKDGINIDDEPSE